MQAIVTKYLGATDSHGSRIKATADGGSITVSWDSALDIEENHRVAAMALVNKLGWFRYAPSGYWAMGSLPGKKNGFVFVCFK